MRSVVEHYCKIGSTVTVCALDISKAFDRVNNYALLSLLIDRKVPKYFTTIMLKWFQHSTASVRWGGALSATFNILVGVIRQCGLLSPLLFSVYMDVLLNRLRRSGLGCCMANNYFGCLVYADDIILLSHSVNMPSMFAICEQFAFDFVMKFYTQKSVVMRVSERYDVMCAPLMLHGKEILFVHSLKYLGVRLLASVLAVVLRV